MELSRDEVRTDVMYQIGALEGFARAAGTTVRHVCPHGRLGTLSSPLTAAMRSVSPTPSSNTTPSWPSIPCRASSSVKRAGVACRLP